MHSTAGDMSCPALCPGHAAVLCIPLGRWPSLHLLRPKLPRFVRRLRWYYAIVRLPVFVHHRRASLDFPMRPITPSLLMVGKHRLSRFPRKMFPCMYGVSDRAEPATVLRWRRSQCCLPLPLNTSALRSLKFCFSRLNTRPARSPVNASPGQLLVHTHDLGPVWFAAP